MNQHACRKFSLFVVLLGLYGALGWVSAAVAQDAAATQPAPAAEWTDTKYNWYSISLDDSRVGWMSSKVESSGKQLRTTVETQTKFKRGSTNVEIGTKSVIVETTDGKPVSLYLQQTVGKVPTESIWEYREDRIIHTSRQYGQETVRELPLPEEQWLPPQALERFCKEQRQSGSERFSFSTIDPQVGIEVGPILFTTRRVGEANLETGGQMVPVTVWSTTMDRMQVQIDEKYRPDGELVYQEIPTGMGKMITQLSTRDEVLRDEWMQAPDVLLQTLIRPSQPVANPTQAWTATYRLKVKEGRMPVLPSAGAQRVELGEDGTSAIVTIRIRNPLPATEAEIASHEFIEATPIVNSEDPLILKFADLAVRKPPDWIDPTNDLFGRADALWYLAFRHITGKNRLTTVFATASEVARGREGDCTEHAVFLCALLRAEGVPARVASGLIYSEEFAGQKNVFSWHMWVQALIDGKWIDYDASLPVKFHAGHVLTGTSSLQNGLSLVDLSTLMQLIGNLEIEVLEVGYE